MAHGLLLSLETTPLTSGGVAKTKTGNATPGDFRSRTSI